MIARRNSLVIIYKVPGVQSPHAWGTFNILDGRVIVPAGTFDDPIYTYEGDLVLDYSYYVRKNDTVVPVRSSNMIEPVDTASFRLVYTAATTTLRIDGTRTLASAGTRMPSIMAVVYMLAQRGDIDISYSKCVVNYCNVFNFCLLHGISLHAPLATGTSVINTERKAIHTIDPAKWDTTIVANIILPTIATEFYIINAQTGVQRVIPYDQMGAKWCRIETTDGVVYDVLWEALTIYIEKLFTRF